jgi:hypothetical protein
MRYLVMKLRPMSDFDPARPALVHDSLNDRTFEWKPDEFLEHYREHAQPAAKGVIGWDGLLLDGWQELP